MSNAMNEFLEVRFQRNQLTVESLEADQKVHLMEQAASNQKQASLRSEIIQLKRQIGAEQAQSVRPQHAEDLASLHAQCNSFRQFALQATAQVEFMNTRIDALEKEKVSLKNAIAERDRMIRQRDDTIRDFNVLHKRQAFDHARGEADADDPPNQDDLGAWQADQARPTRRSSQKAARRSTRPSSSAADEGSSLIYVDPEEDATISIPTEMPTIGTLRNFKLAVYTSVVAASGGRDERRVTQWLREVTDPATGFDDLSNCPGDMQSIDRKLGLAVQAIVTGVIKESVMNLQSQRLEKGSKLLAGRQVLWMLYNHFATDAHWRSMHCISDLATLARNYPGDSQMESAWTAWETMVADLSPENANLLLPSLLMYLRPSEELESLVMNFRMRLRGGDACATYQELRRRWERHLQIRREDRNRASFEQSLLSPASAR